MSSPKLNVDDPTMPASLRAKIAEAAKNPVRYEVGPDAGSVPAATLEKAAASAAPSKKPSKKAVVVQCGEVKLKLTLKLIVWARSACGHGMPRARRVRQESQTKQSA